MQVHYFQRYHKGEDVATANTMLLLTRLYDYSPSMFFRFLKEQYFGETDYEPELKFALQDTKNVSGKKGKSIPDATIIQPSFKVVIETKMGDWFDETQLRNHLEKFSNEDYMVLLTLAPDSMDETKKAVVERIVTEYNQEKHLSIHHENTTFEQIFEGIRAILTDRDSTMKEVLDDYYEYCEHDGLIKHSDAHNKMRMVRAGTTFAFNRKANLYYSDTYKHYSDHDYLGLYTDKSIRAIGKIVAIITAVKVEGKLKYIKEKGEIEITDEIKKRINEAIEDGKNYGYQLDDNRYYFVEEFYETNFRKITPRAPMGTRYFDLAECLGTKELPDTKEIARILKEKTWS